MAKTRRKSVKRSPQIVKSGPYDSLPVPDRIRAHSYEFCTCLRLFLRLGVLMPQSINLSNAGVIAEALEGILESVATGRGLSEYYGAGYLELCRSAQMFEVPSVWSWQKTSLMCVSHHYAAARWASNAITDLGNILGAGMWTDVPSFKSSRANPQQFRDRCESANRELVQKWSDKIVAIPEDVFPLLSFERIQTLLVCNAVPATLLGKSPANQLELEESKPRSLGITCTKCGGPMIVKSSGRKGSGVRKLKCKNCNRNAQITKK